MKPRHQKSFQNKFPINRWFILSFLFWLSFVFLIFTVSPDSQIAKISFFIILFFSFLSTLFIFFKKIKINFFISLYLIFLLILLFFRQFNILNVILITALLGIIFKGIYNPATKNEQKNN